MILYAVENVDMLSQLTPCAVDTVDIFDTLRS